MVWPHTRILPLHAIWEDIRVVHPCLTKTVRFLYRTVRVEVVSSISRVDDDRVGVDHTGAEKRNQYRPSRYRLSKSHDVRRPIKRYSQKTCFPRTLVLLECAVGQSCSSSALAHVNGVAKAAMFTPRGSRAS